MIILLHNGLIVSSVSTPLNKLLYNYNELILYTTILHLHIVIVRDRVITQDTMAMAMATSTSTSPTKQSGSERSTEGFETMLVESSNARHVGIDVDVDYRDHRSNSPALTRLTSFRSPSNSNHGRHRDNDDGEEEDDDDEEAVAAAATFGAMEVEDDDNKPTSSSSTRPPTATAFHFHRFQSKMNHPWPWSLVLVLSLAISGVGYKYSQLHKRNAALENELRSLKSTMLVALPSTSEVEVKGAEKKKKGTKAPKVECVSSSEPSVSRVGE